MSNNRTETTNYAHNGSRMSHPHISRTWYAVGLLTLVIPALCVCTFCIFVILHGKLYRKTKLYILMVSQVAMDIFKVTISFYVLTSLFMYDTKQPEMGHYDVQAFFGDAEQYAYQGQLLHHIALAVVRLMHMTQRPNRHHKCNVDTISSNLGIAIFIWFSGAIIFGAFKTTCMTFGNQQYYARHLTWGMYLYKEQNFTTISECYDLYWKVFQQHHITSNDDARDGHLDANEEVINDSQPPIPGSDEKWAMLKGHAKNKKEPLQERRPLRKSAKNNTCTTNSQARKAEVKLVIFLAANTFCQVINSLVWHASRSTMTLYPLTDVINSAIGSVLYLLQLDQIRSHAKVVLCGRGGLSNINTTTSGTTMATTSTRTARAVTTQQQV